MFTTTTVVQYIRFFINNDNNIIINNDTDCPHKLPLRCRSDNRIITLNPFAAVINSRSESAKGCFDGSGRDGLAVWNRVVTQTIGNYNQNAVSL